MFVLLNCSLTTLLISSVVWALQDASLLGCPLLKRTLAKILILGAGYSGHKFSDHPLLLI